VKEPRPLTGDPDPRCARIYVLFI